MGLVAGKQRRQPIKYESLSCRIMLSQNPADRAICVKLSLQALTSAPCEGAHTMKVTLLESTLIHMPLPSPFPVAPKLLATPCASKDGSIFELDYMFTTQLPQFLAVALAPDIFVKPLQSAGPTSHRLSCFRHNTTLPRAAS